MLTFDITVLTRGFEKHINMGIATQQVDVLTGQIFNGSVDNFVESETIACTPYYS